MRRQSRGLQFWASQQETHSFLTTWRALGMHSYGVAEGVFGALDGPGRLAQTPTRIYVAAEPVSAPDAHRSPARWGLVVFDVPVLADNELQMATLGAVNYWAEDEGAYYDDTALRLFDRLKRELKVSFVASVEVRSVATGEGRTYRELRTTKSAIDLWRAGNRFVQRGVPGNEYRPQIDEST